jgi:hypothetical protein
MLLCGALLISPLGPTIVASLFLANVILESRPLPPSPEGAVFNPVRKLKSRVGNGRGAGGATFLTPVIGKLGMPRVPILIS